jgi:hypothetical protein
VGVNSNSCGSLHDEQFPTVVIISGSLVRFIRSASFPVGCSRPRTLVVSSGGSQYHGRSPRLGDSGTPTDSQIQQLSSCRSGSHCSIAAHPGRSTACSTLGLLYTLLRTPTVAIEVLRFIVDLLLSLNRLRLALLQLNIQALLFPC